VGGWAVGRGEGLSSGEGKIKGDGEREKNCDGLGCFEDKGGQAKERLENGGKSINWCTIKKPAKIRLELRSELGFKEEWDLKRGKRQRGMCKN
jgi:hypothetical protein